MSGKFSVNIKNRSVSFSCNFGNYEKKYEENIKNYIKKDEKDLDFILIDDDEIDSAQTLDLFERLPLKNRIHLFYETQDAMKFFEVSYSFSNNPLNVIILLDQKMPNISGIEFLEELRRTPAVSDAPVFLLTHLADETLVFDACEQYAQGFFVKPLNIKELSSQISDLPGYSLRELEEGIQFIKNI